MGLSVVICLWRLTTLSRKLNSPQGYKPAFCTAWFHPFAPACKLLGSSVIFLSSVQTLSSNLWALDCRRTLVHIEWKLLIQILILIVILTFGGNLPLPGWLAMYLVGSLYSLPSTIPFLYFLSSLPYWRANAWSSSLCASKFDNFRLRSSLLSLEMLK